MAWRIKTMDKKSVEEINFLYKTLEDGTNVELKQSQGYRWGEVTVENPPENYDPSEGPLNVSELGIIDHSYEDGCWSDVYWDQEISEEEEESILDAGYWLEDIGYEYGDSEVFFYGPLEIEEVEDY